MAASTADVSPDSCAETIVFVNETNSVNIGKSVDRSSEDDPPNVPPVVEVDELLFVVVVPALDDDELVLLAAEAAPLARLFCVKVLAPAIIDINACCCAGLIVDVGGGVEVVFPVDGATTGGPDEDVVDSGKPPLAEIIFINC